MNKAIYILSVAVLVGATMTSCTSTKKTFQSSPVQSRNVQLDPIRADIEVNEDKRLSGESKATYLFGFIRLNGSNSFASGINYSGSNAKFGFGDPRMAKVQSSAAFDALKAGTYDFMVHPSYMVTTDWYLIIRKYKVTVTGYGANYKNFRTEKQKVVITNNAEEYVFPAE